MTRKFNNQITSDNNQNKSYQINKRENLMLLLKDAMNYDIPINKPSFMIGKIILCFKLLSIIIIIKL